jgi:hypothetical protein
MGTVERIATLLVLVGLAATLVARDSQTVPVLKTIFSGFQGSLKTAEGRG